MPLPQLTLPDGLPCFLLRGHELQKASQYAHVRFQTGHSRARRVWTVGEKMVEVALILEADQAAAFRDWYEGPLQEANGIFSAHVANDEDDGAEQLWYSAEFEGPVSWDAMHLERWQITATLRLTGAGQAEGPYTGELSATAVAALTGSVRGTVEPMLAATSVAALEQLTVPTGLAATSVAALLQPVYFAATSEAALEQE